MKKILFSIVILMFLTNCLFAQSKDILTNSTIIKMVKANLSEELIIDEVNNSKVNFNLKSTDLILLSNEKVSATIIKAMKAAQAKQSIAAVPQLSETKPIDSIKPIINNINIQPITIDSTILKNDTLSKKTSIQMKDTVKQEVINPIFKDTFSVNEKHIDTVFKPLQITDTVQKKKFNILQNEKSVITVESVSYTIPLEEIIQFFDNKYNSFVDEIMMKDKRIRDTVNEGNLIYGLIQANDIELTDKKNADAKKYSDDILMLKNKLKNYRLRYAQYKMNMLIENTKIAKELNGFNEQLNKEIAAKFNGVSQNIKKIEYEYSKGRIAKNIEITKQKNNAIIISHITPMKELLFFYQNEISSVQNLISQWSKTADSIIYKDADLSLQLDSLKKEIENKKINAKQNKKEISALKNQCSIIEKEKKQLAKQMQIDIKELSNYLKEFGKDIQITLKERFLDIIDNINYQFQNKL